MAYVTALEDGPILQNKRRFRTTICDCLCHLLLVAIFGFVLLVLCGMIYESAVTNLQLPKFQVESATVTQLNIESSQLTARWDIILLATNPKGGLKSYYGHVQAGVRYRDGFGAVHTLVTEPLPSFVLPRRNHTRVGLSLGFRGQPGGQVVRDISDERNSDVVTFGVVLRAKVWFKPFNRYSSKLPAVRGWLLVSCDNVDFGFSGENGTGDMTSLSGQCNVNLYPLGPFGNTKEFPTM